MQTRNRQPESAYECWCMPCRECIHYDHDKNECHHPDCYPDSPLYPEP